MSGDVVGDRKMDGPVAVPVFDRNSGRASQHVLPAEPTIRSDDGLSQAEYRLTQEHIQEDGIQFDRISQNEGMLCTRFRVGFDLDITTIVQIRIHFRREYGIIQQTICFLAKGYNLIGFQHARDMDETLAM